MVGRLLNEFGYHAVFKIFLTVLFDILTNNVSFLFLILHLFKCVALLCIYIIVIVFLLIHICGISILLCMYFHMTHVTSGSCVLHIDRQKLSLNL